MEVEYESLPNPNSSWGWQNNYNGSPGYRHTFQAREFGSPSGTLYDSLRARARTTAVDTADLSDYAPDTVPTSHSCSNLHLHSQMGDLNGVTMNQTEALSKNSPSMNKTSPLSAITETNTMADFPDNLSSHSDSQLVTPVKRSGSYQTNMGMQPYEPNFSEENSSLVHPYSSRSMDMKIEQQSHDLVAKYKRHVMIPYILSGYLQLFFNLLATCALLYLAYAVIVTVNNDIELKVVDTSGDIMNEIATCTRHYTDNRCSPVAERLPALEVPCNTWASCMNRDPLEVARGRVSAEALAEIINSFVEPISYKTMVFFGMLVVCILGLSNYGLRLQRLKIDPIDPPTHPHPHAR
eukprot:GCRY01005984.1.p1 GENE.GCRY01005984.1~~GCRY01005984.1.p1  ORF type:complete len:403 (+),score=52.97 GCRY01005984.1:157-1209(+)